MHPAGAELTQRLGQLPAILALDWSQQAFEEPMDPAAHLGAPKPLPNARLHLSEGLGGHAEQAQIAFDFLLCYELL